MTTGSIVRVGVLGAGAWARGAHLPGISARSALHGRRDRRLGDRSRPRRRARVRHSVRDRQSARSRSAAMTSTPSTSARRATRISSSAWAALEAGKHVLCEKPVAYDYRDTRRARDLARQKHLKTKVGLTFRYSPAMRYMRELVANGFIGTPFIFNGYEQNSQWLDPRDAAAAGRSRRRSVDAAGLVARRLRRADHRPRATSSSAAISARWSAPCATSSPSAWSAPPAG